MINKVKAKETKTFNKNNISIKIRKEIIQSNKKLDIKILY